MGCGISSPLPILPNKNYMNVSIFNCDTLVLLYPDKTLIEAVKNAIVSNWKKGITREGYKFDEDPYEPKGGNYYEFKLKGNPFFHCRARETAVQSRLMCTEILKSLYNLGWKLLVSSDLTRSHNLNSWFFERQPLPKDPCVMFCIGLSSSDKLQINDCPDLLHDTIRETCQNTWVKGIQSEDKCGRTYDIKLRGNPWRRVNKSESCSSRNMIKGIIEKLSANQYELYGNSDLTGTADTLFFRYNPSLQTEEQLLIVSLNRYDRIRLINVPGNICSSIRETVAQHWPKGIQDEITDENCFELKLKGRPWWAHGQDAIYSRFMISKIMEKLASHGYFVITGIDVSRKVDDKSVFLFRRGAPLQTSFMCVSLNETNKIRFIDAPPNVVEAGRSIIHRSPLGVDVETAKHDGVTYEVKMNGNPWSMRICDGIHGRCVLLGLLGNFYPLGWRLVCSADVSGKFVHQDNAPDYPTDVHSWWFMYDESMLQLGNGNY